MKHSTIMCALVVTEAGLFFQEGHSHLRLSAPQLKRRSGVDVVFAFCLLESDGLEGRAFERAGASAEG